MKRIVSVVLRAVATYVIAYEAIAISISLLPVRAGVGERFRSWWDYTITMFTPRQSEWGDAVIGLAIVLSILFHATLALLRVWIRRRATGASGVLGTASKAPQ